MNSETNSETDSNRGRGIHAFSHNPGQPKTTS